MILNLIIIVFVLGMALIWSTYGMFSAFLQLLLTIVAGAIAFAVWEPLTALLLDYTPAYAWALGLIGPFGLALLLLRVVMDKFVSGNMQIPKLADQILGGAFGALSAVVAGGVTLIGISHLPLPEALLGYQPYEIKADGTLGPSEGDGVASLWVPVDRVAANLFTYLSTRGFSSASPLASVHPDLFEEVGAYRLGRFYDPNSSLIAEPANVSVTAVQTFTEELPGQLGEEILAWLTETSRTRAGDQVVTVSTQWEHPKGGATFDGDKILRLPPYQTQLVAEVPGEAGLQRYLPVGWTKVSDSSTDREFYFVANNQSMATETAPPADIIFIYAIPDDATPRFFQARGVRLGLPGDITNNDASVLVAALGLPKVEGEEGDDEPAVVSNPDAAGRVGEEIIGGYANHHAVGLEQTAALARAISPNDATGLDVNDDGFVTGGKDTTDKRGAGGAAAKSIAIPGSLQPIRLLIEPTAVSQSPIGNAVSGGTTNPQFWVEASNGKKFKALGYSWLSDSTQEISINSIERTGDLPLNSFKKGDKLYVYFQIPPHIVLARYHIGEAYQELTFTVENKPPPRRR